MRFCSASGRAALQRRSDDVFFFFPSFPLHQQFVFRSTLSDAFCRAGLPPHFGGSGKSFSEQYSPFKHGGAECGLPPKKRINSRQQAFTGEGECLLLFFMRICAPRRTAGRNPGSAEVPDRYSERSFRVSGEMILSRYSVSFRKRLTAVEVVPARQARSTGC